MSGELTSGKNFVKVLEGLNKMFLETELDPRTGAEKGQKKVTREQVLERHPNNHDIQAWAKGARVGSVFSLMAHGYKYERLPD